MLKQPRLILASSSPRRRELLKDAGLQFEVIAADIAEIPGAAETPEGLARRLALEKATAVALLHPDAWVLGADTDVSIDGEILGKPRDGDDAKRMLNKIQGRKHQVWGGFALVNRAQRVSYAETHCTTVEISPMDAAAISWYVATGEPMDKAGAYGAQGIGARFIRAVEGSYTNVVGLPVDAVMAALQKFGVHADG